MSASRQLFKLKQLVPFWSCLFVCLAYCYYGEASSPQTTTKDVQTQEEFTHLLSRLTANGASSNRRVHLISEHTRNGHRLQLEEFLDLDSWSQLLQFKWHEDEKLEGSESQVLSTKKISVLVLNDGPKKVIVQYEPYSCDSSVIDTTTSSSNDATNGADWWLAIDNAENYEAIKPRIRHSDTIDSIISQAPNSPYFARVPISGGSEAWVFGVAGLWLKAQYSGSNDNSSSPSRISHLEEGVEVSDSQGWHLNLDYARTSLMYYFNSDFISDDYERKPAKTSTESDDLEMIELRNLKTTHLVDLINVISTDFNLADSLAEDLFKLPIGYNCHTNPLLSISGINFESTDSQLQATLRQLEIVATRYGTQSDTSIYSSTEVKSLSLATCKHPMNSAASLALFQIAEDRFKLIRDYHSRLAYQIHFNGTTNHCQISGLHIFDFKHRQATEPIEVLFSNGINLNLNEVFLEYLFNSKGLAENEQHYLNKIANNRQQEGLEELVFESQVPDSYVELLEVIDKQTGRPLGRRVSLIRVYERLYSVMDEGNIYKMRRRQTQPRLSRIILIVLDHGRREKLAEVRFNLIKTIRGLSFAKRAQLFDVSQCHSDKDSMELEVSYPVPTKQLAKYAQSRSHELVNEFYLSSINWGILKEEDNNETLFPSSRREKQRLGLSLNFLRVPRVELLSSSSGSATTELKLRLLVLDKVSPLHLFDQMVESTFVTDGIDEKLLVGDVQECAGMCRLHNCRQFAFDDSSLECKLCPISMEDQLDDDDGDEDQDENPDDEKPITIIRKVTSRIYYAPARVDQIDSQAAPFGEEASLAELHSFLEHNSEEFRIEEPQAEVEEEDSLSVNTRTGGGTRQRRDLKGINKESLASWPLLSFQFTDKSTQKEVNFAPPERMVLIPAEIKPIKVPLSIDLSQESAQKIKVASAFRTQLGGKKFQPNLLDDPIWTPQRILNADERTFIDRFSNVYYTLKRLHLIELDTCALMCYNIDQWDSQAKAEQICQSFSYCREQRDCILMIKTDINFTETLTELVQEGDRLLDTNSTDEFLVDEPGCIVSARNYLTGFDGPIRLPPGKHGYKSTGDHLPLLGPHLEYEWLTVFNLESGDIYEDSQDNCAKECNKRNRIDQRMCLAMDFCITKTSPTFQDHQANSRYETVCDLFIVSGDYSAHMVQSLIISRVRQELIQRGVAASPSNDSSIRMESTCNRYLISHLSEFNHVKMRQISQELGNQLKRIATPMENLNLDGCALECSLKKTECLAFQYCNKFDQVSKMVQKNCSLYGGSIDNHSSSKLDGQKSSSVQQVSTYSEDCHIYLRSEFNSLEDLLDFVPKQSRETDTYFEHGQLLIVCTVLFLISLCVVYLYFRSTSRYQQRFR